MHKTAPGRLAAAALLTVGALLTSLATTPTASARPTPETPPAASTGTAPGTSASTTPESPSATSTGAAPATPLAGASEAPFVEDNVLFQQKTNGYACFRIPAIVRAANGIVLAFAEGRVADCGDDGDIDVVLRRSTDGGQTWGPLQVVSEGNGSTHGNPVPIVDNRTGRIVLVTTQNGPAPCPNGCDRDPYVQTSDDSGATWTAPREMTEGKLPSWNFWYATGPMHGIQLQHGQHSGRLIVGANFETYDGVGPHIYGTHLLYSDDSGQTWHIGATTSRDDGTVIAQEVTVVELTDGQIYALARERGTDPGSRAYAISSDGGETFDRPFRTLPRLVMPDVQGSLLRFSARNDGDWRNRILF
jgi:Neuraminidase (sialidase)